MDKKYNGSGKKPEKEQKILQFPAPGKRGSAPAKAAPMFNFSKIPPFTRYLIAVLLLVHAGLLLLDENTRYQVFYTFGFVPAYFSGAASGFSDFGYLGPVTHMFIHAGWMHIAFNSLMALTFGILFEREFGARRTAIFWFACGLAGALVYFLLNPALASPMIGASGSISGLFAAAILSMHTQKQRMGAPAGRGPWPLLVFWLAFMIFTGMISGNDTAWQAHAGGFVCGAGLYYGFLKKRGRL
ncbi:MAG: rhomboid family intramembrane serine protease [Alphaproteobacteria bacterium]